MDKKENEIKSEIYKKSQLENYEKFITECNFNFDDFFSEFGIDKGIFFNYFCLAHLMIDFHYKYTDDIYIRNNFFGDFSLDITKLPFKFSQCISKINGKTVLNCFVSYYFLKFDYEIKEIHGIKKHVEFLTYFMQLFENKSECIDFF
jgi:hypothetical protein